MRIPEINGLYNQTVFRQSARIYEPKAMYYRILSAYVILNSLGILTCFYEYIIFHDKDEIYPGTDHSRRTNCA